MSDETTPGWQQIEQGFSLESAESFAERWLYREQHDSLANQMREAMVKQLRERDAAADAAALEKYRNEWLSGTDPGKVFISRRIARDTAVVELCADKLAEHEHHHAANALRKMLREGKLLP
jgi:hypothetical protein